MKNQLLTLSLAFAMITVSAFAAKQDCTPARHCRPDSLEALLMANETATWEALKNNHPAAFLALCLKDNAAGEIFADGSFITFEDVAATFATTQLHSYTLSNMTVFMISKDAAVVRYNAVADMSYWMDPDDDGEGTNGPEPFQWVPADPVPVISSAVWVRTPKGWKAAMYQETAI